MSEESSEPKSAERLGLVGIWVRPSCSRHSISWLELSEADASFPPYHEVRRWL